MIKQVIILRKDINMRKGKCVAQGCHASINAYFDAVKIPYSKQHTDATVWTTGLHTKICVSVDSEAELLGIYQKAKDANLPCSLIKDAGLTEFKEPTYTAVAIGPACEEEINKITGSLKLL